MKIISAVLVLVLGVGCGAAAEGGAVEADIVGGTADRGDPSVVAIDLGGVALCTGTVVAPNVVLTARHCVSETSEEVACPAFGSQILGDRDPKTFRILAGNEVENAEEVAVGQALVVPDDDVLCDADVAFVVLDRDVDLTPIELSDEAPKVGEKLRLVGFGLTGDDGSAGRKRVRTGVPVTAVSETELQTGEGTCSGDSGGPAFAADGRVVGVTSRGGPSCEGRGTRNVFTRAGAFADLLEQARGGTDEAPEDACGVHKHCPTGSTCTKPKSGGPRVCQRR